MTHGIPKANLVQGNSLSLRDLHQGILMEFVDKSITMQVLMLKNKSMEVHGNAGTQGDEQGGPRTLTLKDARVTCQLFSYCVYFHIASCSRKFLSQ